MEGGRGPLGMGDVGGGCCFGNGGCRVGVLWQWRRLLHINPPPQGWLWGGREEGPPTEAGGYEEGSRVEIRRGSSKGWGNMGGGGLQSNGWLWGRIPTQMGPPPGGGVIGEGSLPHWVKHHCEGGRGSQELPPPQGKIPQDEGPQEQLRRGGGFPQSPHLQLWGGEALKGGGRH